MMPGASTEVALRTGFTRLRGWIEGEGRSCWLWGMSGIMRIWAGDMIESV